jgi:hypothetical protein
MTSFFGGGALAPGGGVMQPKERRAQLRRSAVLLRRELSEAQSFALVGLENFGWELKFIRHPLFQEPVAVVSDGTSVAVLDRDGQLVEQVPITVRH